MAKAASMASDDDGSSFELRHRSDYEEFCGEVSEDFVNKLSIEERRQRRCPSEGYDMEQSSRDSFESAVSDHHQEEEEEEGDEDFEFSFACVDPDGSLISADELFHNGQIRPRYPLFDQSLLLEYYGEEPKESGPRPQLKKLFVEIADDEEPEEGTYCVWNGKSVKEVTEGCRKSNSTGFSRRWRFRDLVKRSSSDGKDAFVFLNPNCDRGNAGKLQNAKKVDEVTETTASNKEGKTTAAAIAEKHYAKKKSPGKESGRRKSYLPYRPELVGLGFFANVNGMTRNIHPF